MRVEQCCKHQGSFPAGHLQVLLHKSSVFATACMLNTRDSVGLPSGNSLLSSSIEPLGQHTMA